MIIEWEGTKDAKWTDKEKEKFIKEFESKAWPQYYELFKTQPINALAVHTYIQTVDIYNCRIDFEVTSKSVTIFVFPWLCVHIPESIRNHKDYLDQGLWLMGSIDL